MPGFALGFGWHWLKSFSEDPTTQNSRNLESASKENLRSKLQMPVGRLPQQFKTFIHRPGAGLPESIKFLFQIVGSPDPQNP